MYVYILSEIKKLSYLLLGGSYISESYYESRRPFTLFINVVDCNVMLY